MRIALDGTVTAANLLSAWLWAPPQPEKVPDIYSLLGENVFFVYARNIHRIPIEDKRNHSFFESKFRIEYHIFGDASTAPLTDMRRKYPRLQSYYAAMDKDSLDNLWQYRLHIKHRAVPGTLQQFKTTVSAVVDEGRPAGYIAVYQPLGETRDLIERVYECCISQGTPYVQTVDQKEDEQPKSRFPYSRMQENEVTPPFFDLSYPKTKDDYSTIKKPNPSDEDFWTDILGPLLTEEEVQQRLGLKQLDTVFKRVEQKKLLALPTRNGPAYPTFQFTDQDKVFPAIPRIITIFTRNHSVVTPYEIGAWLNGIHPELNETTPLEWIQQRKNPRRVTLAAEHDSWTDAPQVKP